MRHLFAILSFLLVINNSLLSQGSDMPGYESLDPYYFHLNYIIDSNSVLIDVREFFEYRHSRIKDAIHIPTSGNFDLIADTLDKEAALFLYCYNDYRSRKAAQFFIDKGFKRVYSLEGGIVQWRRDKMPVEKKRIKKKKATGRVR